MWEGCTTAALPTPTSTGHYLCSYHLAQAYATVRAAQDALDQVQAIPVDNEWTASNEEAWEDTWVIHHGLLVERAKMRRWPLGKWVPLMLFGIVFLLTTVFPVNDRWGYHIPMAFICFALFPALLSMWFGGDSEGREVKRGGINATDATGGESQREAFMRYTPGTPSFEDLHRRMNERTWEG
jgi:hypothetical protein